MTSVESQTGSLTIGLPICNEAQNLHDFLRRLARCVDELDVEVETLACLNGCTDDSATIVEGVARSPVGERLGLRTLESVKGKVNAIIEILYARRFEGPLCFLDADILLYDSTLAALLAELHARPRVQVCYARCVPFYWTKRPTSAFEAAQRAYYRYREYLPARRYFHGRAYLLRDDSALREMAEANARVRADEELGPDLADGIRGDDIYLSGAIVHAHGGAAIHEVPDAVVAFHPPADESELGAAVVRAVCEIDRVRRLFPQLWLEDSRIDQLYAIMNERERGIERDTALAYVVIERRLWDAAVGQVDSDRAPPTVQTFRESGWLRLASTKQPFAVHDCE